MRIGIFTCNYKPLRNGVVTSITSYLEQFDALGHETFIFAPRYPAACKAQTEPNVYRFPSLRAPTHGSYALPIPFSPRISAEITRLDLHVIHTQHPFLLGPYALTIARRLRLPLVFTYHTRYDLYGHYSPVFPHLSSRLALKRSLKFANLADAVVALTRASADMLLAMGVRSRIEIIPTGISLRRPSGDFRALRRGLGIPFSAKVVLFVGRLALEKNLNLLLTAFGSVLKRAPQTFLIIVGNGDEKVALMGFAAQLGLRGNIVFVDEVSHEEVWNYYAIADVFALPSHSEVQPLAPLEAMASSLPVVAVKYPGIEDYIIHGENGYITDRSSWALAFALLDLLMEPDKLRRCSLAARQKSEEFSAVMSAHRMIRLYESLLPPAPNTRRDQGRFTWQQLA
jgi:glycosyltransferase involved in cell wall biosynthesis